MKIKVTEKQVMITEISQVNEGEYGINRCDFSLPKSFDGLCVTAVFNGVPAPLTEGRCIIPPLKNGNCIVGVYAYRQADGETEIMYSPKPTMFFVEKGSFCSCFEEIDVPQVYDYETYCQMLQGYWREIIDSNTLPEIKTDATKYQYYSAKVINLLYENIMGELDEISVIIGGEA